MLAKWLSITGNDSVASALSLHEADSAQSAAPIDYTVLEQIVPDYAEHMQVLHDFQLHIRGDHAKLILMLDQDDRINVEHTAHRMKGSCRMVGARDMAYACADIEQAARDGDMAAAKAARLALDKAIEQFEAFLIIVANRK